MKLKFVLATLLLVPITTIAGVNPQNGDFYISYTDVSMTNNDHVLEITRSYNSISSELGWFGYGWGSKYETRLVVLPDGSVAIKEGGNGRTTYYRNPNQSSFKVGVQSIVETATLQDQLTSSAADELTAKLLSNEELRVEKVIKFGIHVELPMNTALDDFCGKASLIRITDGYRRFDCDRFSDSESATDTFDLQGRLIRRELTNGYAVTIHYGDTGTAEIRDSLKQSITLAWTREGRVASAKTSKEEAKYTYDSNQDLVEAIDTGSPYRYSYDNNHNLTRIIYGDDSSKFISYSPRYNGKVDAITERDGEQQTFVYRTDPENPNRTWTKHTIITNTGQITSKEFQYENQVNDTGSVQLAKSVVTGSGNSKATKYDSLERVISKIDASGTVVKYAYHPKNGKISAVMINDLKTKFRYDKHGNLIQAKNNNGQVINLFYHSAQVRRLVEVNLAENIRHELKFKYNAEGRPVEITLVGTGKITVKYDDKGEINSVASNQGDKVALPVTKIFQNLMKVVAVAGVRL